MAQLLRSQAALGLPLSFSRRSLHVDCRACELGKMARLKFGGGFSSGVERVHDKAVGDTCGPILLEASDDQWGHRSIVKTSISLVVDVFSRRVSATVITNKAAASQHVLAYFFAAKARATAEPQPALTQAVPGASASHLVRQGLQQLHVDGGSEYNRCEAYLEAKGVKVSRTPIFTPQWNGIVERKNRTLLEMTRALLYHARLPSLSLFFGYAFEAAVYTHNRVTIRDVSGRGATLHEWFSGAQPDLRELHPFGCDCVVKVPVAHLQGAPAAKLAARAELGIFLGRDQKREGCHRVLVEELPLLVPDSLSQPYQHSAVLKRCRIVVSRDVLFHESSFTLNRALWAKRYQLLSAQLERSLQQERLRDPSAMQGTVDASTDFLPRANERTNAQHELLEQQERWRVAQAGGAAEDDEIIPMATADPVRRLELQAIPTQTAAAPPSSSSSSSSSISSSNSSSSKGQLHGDPRTHMHRLSEPGPGPFPQATRSAMKQQ